MDRPYLMLEIARAELMNPTEKVVIYVGDSEKELPAARALEIMRGMLDRGFESEFGGILTAEEKQAGDEWIALNDDLLTA